MAIAAAAFALRAGAAVLTEHTPIFPSYYYTDAAFVDKYARAAVDAWAAGQQLPLSYSPPQRAHILLTAAIYWICGPHQIAAKLFNALAASGGILAFGLLAGRLFSPRVGMIAAALMAVWPSHVFYTSQNFKEGLFCAIMMGAFQLLTPRDPAARRGGLAELAGGLVLLVTLGFLRSYVMVVAAAALASVALMYLRRGQTGRTAAFLLAVALSAPLLYEAALTRLRLNPPKTSVDRTGSALVPNISDSADGRVYKPLSPRGITEFRRLRQYSDRVYAKGLGREIGTQLFPGERLDSWLDVLLFIPKASFHVLFMPLPGLYPMDGKPGRMLAAAENLILLALFALGLAAALRGGFEPRRLGLLLFFAAMTVGSSLLEFDLGSAGRHKLMFLPMLFPFAAEEGLRLAGIRRKA